MAVQGNVSDELIRVQQDLFASLKMSHGLFLRQFYLGAISGPLASLFVLLNTYLNISVDPWLLILTIFVILTIPILIWARMMDKSIRFLRWSRRLFREFEESKRSSQVLVGLTAYMNRLFKVIFAGTLRSRNPHDVAPRELLNALRHRAKIKRVLIFIVFIIGAATIFLYAEAGDSPLNPRFLLFLGGLLCVFGLVALILTYQHKWGKSIAEWVYFYEILDRWGKEIEQTFMPTYSEDTGGY